MFIGELDSQTELQEHEDSAQVDDGMDAMA